MGDERVHHAARWSVALGILAFVCLPLGPVAPAAGFLSWFAIAIGVTALIAGRMRSARDRNLSFAGVVLGIIAGALLFILADQGVIELPDYP